MLETAAGTFLEPLPEVNCVKCYVKARDLTYIFCFYCKCLKIMYNMYTCSIYDQSLDWGKLMFKFYIKCTKNF